MLRLFVAADIDASARERLVSWRRRHAPMGLRLIAPESLHLTLAFLGTTAPTEVPRIAALLDDMPIGGPATGTLGAVHWLPERRPRVLAVELTDPGRSIERLAEATHAALGHTPDHPRFLPHVTVARGAGRSVALDPPPAAPVHLERVVLYSSHPGSRYEALHAVALP